MIALELPAGERARVATSPAAWLLGLDADAPARSAEARRLAEDYAGRAVRRGDRWVVMIGDHERRRAFRRLVDVELGAAACAPASVLTRLEAEALAAAGIAPAELQPLTDPAADCTELGAARIRGALEHLVELGHAAVQFHDAGRRVSAVISIPNHSVYK